MAYNKFIHKDGRVFLDLTDATDIPPEKLEKGYIAYDRHGNRIEGTGEYNLQEKTTTYNEVITADEGYYGLSKVIVEVPKLDFNGINGVVEKFKVATGSSVSAGDFVEFVSRFKNKIFYNNEIANLAVCNLDAHMLMITYSDMSNNGFGTAQLMYIEDGDVYLGNRKVFCNKAVQDISVSALSSTRAVVAYTTGSSTSDFTANAVILTEEDFEVTVGTAVNFGNGMYTSVVALDYDKAVLAYKYLNNGANGTLRAVVLGVNSSTITFNKEKIAVIGSVTTYNETRLQKLGFDRVILATCDSNSGFRHLCCLTAVNDEITQGAIKYTADDDPNSSYIKHLAITVIPENKILIAYMYAGYLKLELFKVDGNTLTSIVTKDASLGASYDGLCGISAATINNSSVLITGYERKSKVGLMLKVTINTTGTTSISTSAFKIFEYGSVTCASVIVFSNDSAIIFYNNGSGNYTSIDLSSATPSCDSSEVGTYIKPATNRLHNVGVALEGGVAGSTLQVYCVNNKN